LPNKREQYRATGTAVADTGDLAKLDTLPGEHVGTIIHSGARPA
jgi:hypothetical protein